MANYAKLDRNAAIVHLRLTGKTYEECGKQFGITRERVRQISARWGPKTVLAIAKKMADEDVPAQEIAEKLDQCARLKCLLFEKDKETILRSALWQAGRLQDLTLRSGFWLYGPGSMEEQMKHFSVSNGFEILDTTIYLHGECGVFALALHDRLGYPIEALLDDSNGTVWNRLVHLYCPVKVLGQQGFADVRGITTDWNEFLKEYAELSDSWERQPVDPDELRKQMLKEFGKETLEQFYLVAVALIREEQWAYDGSAME